MVPLIACFSKGWGKSQNSFPPLSKREGKVGGGRSELQRRHQSTSQRTFFGEREKPEKHGRRAALFTKLAPLFYWITLSTSRFARRPMDRPGKPACLSAADYFSTPPPSPSSRPFTSSVAGTPPPALPPQRTITLITLPVPLCSFFALKHHMCPSSFPYGIYPHARALRAALLVFPILFVKSRASEPPRRFSQRCARDQGLV